ncbi:hypothetical protein pEaSNUABM38_00027 [Erwinia phage pEa_SNUABM_38]|nr:hypothetical protein pEaSNUABM38_00027 [Erwinia phage pEa_SNUABM_38]
MTRELNEIEKFQLEEVKDLEKTFVDLTGATRYSDSTFRRLGLPILTGLLDDTFNPLLWAEFIGSNYVPLEILTDDLRSVLFTLPPLLMPGPAIIAQDNQQSLSDASTEIALQGAIIAENGGILINQLINGAAGAIDRAMYGINFERARQTITTLNEVFEHYGINGRIEYPEGLSEVSLEEKAAAAPKERERYAIDDGDAL